MSLVGKHVEFDPAQTGGKYVGQVWLVQKKLPVNIEMIRVDAQGNAFGRRMRTHPTMVRELVDGAPTAQAPPVHVPVRITIGSMVRVNGIAKIDPSELFVVMQDKGFTAKLVKLGGDDGRFWPNIPNSMLTVVDIKDILR